MYLTRKWLEKFIDLSEIDNKQISCALNSLGFEVESFKDYSQLNDKLKIAHVGNVSDIKDTHLKFCFVDKGEELVSPIVCGASNVKEGQYVILAEPGKTIANGMTLQEKEIKGKKSEGMICSLTEIGINPNCLTEDEKDWIYSIYTREDCYSMIGSELALEEIGFLDAVWELDLTLNRSDCLGAIQLAKELANYFDLDFKGFSNLYTFKKNQLSTKVGIKVNKNAQNFVNNIASQVVKVKKVISFDKRELCIYSNQDIWLKFNDVKTTNNFWLDLANAIAIETGQPIIFLDPNKLSSQLEIVNNEDEKNKTNLQLICDNKVISTLGVDFDENYLPNSESQEIMVVYLSLDPIFMRKQQKQFNCSNVALQRYIKPISSLLYKVGEEHVMYWLDQYNIYESNSEMEFFKQANTESKEIKVEHDFIEKLIGIKISFNEIKKLFKHLDFKITQENNDLIFKIDPYRVDISNKADVIEEIARLYGYNNIESKPPLILSKEKDKNLFNKLNKQVENYLLGLGFNNIKTYSLISKEQFKDWNIFNIQNPINLMSPLSKERETYRTSLSYSIIEAGSFNYARGNKNIKLYEFGDIYNANDLREKHLSVFISGDILNQKAFNISIKASYQYLKGICEEILKLYNLDLEQVNFQINSDVFSKIHPYINAKVTYQEKLLGFIYKLNPRFEQSQKLENSYVMELNICELEKAANTCIRFKEISKFQKTTRDVSFILNNSLTYKDVLQKAIENVDYICKIELLDIYQDDNLKKENACSVTIAIDFNSNENQLTNEKIQEQWDKLLSNLQKANIEVR